MFWERSKEWGRYSQCWQWEVDEWLWEEQKQKEEGENEECTQSTWRASVFNGKAQPRRSALAGIKRESS